MFLQVRHKVQKGTMNLGQNGALSLFLLISLIHSSAALASQNRGGNDIQREQAPAEHSENAEIPEWLQVAQLISNRLSVSEDLIEDLGITAKNNSLVLNQILNLLQKMEREKPVVCPKVEEKLVVQSEADTSSAGGEQSPKTEIVLETQPRQTSSGDVSEQTDSSEDDGDSQSPVKSRIQRIREKIRAILMNLKENKNPNVLGN